MAKAFKCDVCKGYYDAYNTKQSGVHYSGFIPINVDSEGKYFTNKEVHLCPKCMEATMKLHSALAGTKAGNPVQEGKDDD